MKAIQNVVLQTNLMRVLLRSDAYDASGEEYDTSNIQKNYKIVHKNEYSTVREEEGVRARKL